MVVGDGRVDDDFDFDGGGWLVGGWVCIRSGLVSGLAF